jgi:hypothetical protein
MANITKKLTQLLYLGANPLLLTSLPTEIKQQIRLIRQVNGAGTGYVSFNPGSGVNSLTQVVGRSPQAHVIVEALSSDPDFVLNDFSAIASGIATEDTILLAGPDGVVVSEYEEAFTASSPVNLTAIFTSGGGVIEYSVNEGETWGTLPTIIPPGVSFILRVQHTNAFSATVTLTY